MKQKSIYDKNFNEIEYHEYDDNANIIYKETYYENGNIKSKESSNGTKETYYEIGNIKSTIKVTLGIPVETSYNEIGEVIDLKIKYNVQE